LFFQLVQRDLAEGMFHRIIHVQCKIGHVRADGNRRTTVATFMFTHFDAPVFGSMILFARATGAPGICLQ
jgi:hypothetical protein